ncbi:hypothetical protein [Acidithrix sp. C25]|uniref:hypothetical protein n=1 Tax=Acidithrix sp. C25 TaxID=1671482 RepID=UPI00191B96E1|nr:hypothetical protein [Acidithrix sp. C25]CAG4902484.1 unnamed protein product [Acidithrix sp. C25]
MKDTIVFVKNSYRKVDHTSRRYFGGLTPSERNAIAIARDLSGTSGGKTIAITLGEAHDQDALLEALSLGVDRAILAIGDPSQGAAFVYKDQLASLIRSIAPMALLFGDYSADTGSGLFGAIVAGNLSIGYLFGVEGVKQTKGKFTIEHFDGSSHLLSEFTQLPIALGCAPTNIEIRGDLITLIEAKAAQIETVGLQDSNGLPATWYLDDQGRSAPTTITQSPIGDRAIMRIRSLMGGAIDARRRELIEVNPDSAAEIVLEAVSRHKESN